MVLEIPTENVLTPELKSILECHNLKAVGAAIIVEAIPTPIPEQKKVHVIQKGDTLYKVAKHYGVSVTKLIEINGIVTPNLVTVGQVIKLE